MSGILTPAMKARFEAWIMEDIEKFNNRLKREDATMGCKGKGRGRGKGKGTKPKRGKKR